MPENSKKMLDVKEYKVLGMLPDLFSFSDGKKLKNAEEWALRREEMYASAVELQYGTMPPAPDFFEVEPLYVSKKWSTYRIVAGTKEKQVSFTVRIGRPASCPTERFPVIVDGDGCFIFGYENGWFDVALEKGIGWAIFDRTEIVPDVKSDVREGGLYDVYPEYTFGAVGAWAWGYSRCVDALLKLDLIEADCIAFTGHSRGAKTAMLAGVLDERAAIVNPNETCAGSCSCYRVTMQALTDQGILKRSEELSDLWQNFSFWIGEGMHDYVDAPEKLPFDSHFLKAMIAPRMLLIGEGVHDIWANPIGSWQTTMAAQEAFDFLGASENLLWYFRDGGHGHRACDVAMLVNAMLHKRDGEPLSKELFRRPFEARELIFEPRKK